MMAGALFFYYQGRSYTGSLLALSFPLAAGIMVRLGAPKNRANPIVAQRAAKLAGLPQGLIVVCGPDDGLPPDRNKQAPTAQQPIRLFPRGR